MKVPFCDGPFAHWVHKLAHRLELDETFVTMSGPETMPLIVGCKCTTNHKVANHTGPLFIWVNFEHHALDKVLDKYYETCNKCLMSLKTTTSKNQQNQVLILSAIY